MEKIDARHHNQDTQYEIRKTIVRLRKKGMSNYDVAEAVGVSISQASTIWQKFLKEGMAGIQMGQRGRNHGEKRRLNETQEKQIRKLMIDKTPDQFKLPFSLWTRDAIRMFIKQQYQIDLPLRTITDYLKRWGFSRQKPIKRAYNQNPEAINKWLTQEYPTILKRSKTEKADIYWGDETGIQNNENQMKGFSPKGKTPVMYVDATNNHINMISAISNQGKLRFMFYQDTMVASRLIEFMSRLIKDANRKVFLVLDNLRVHHSKAVKYWLAKNKDKIEVFFLPPYAPEFNPDEYLNNDLKGRLRNGTTVRTQQDLENRSRSIMKTLQNRPWHVKKYFEHPLVYYAS